MKELSCREAGFDCDYVIKAETEEEVLRKGAEHAMMDHGLKQENLTTEFNQRLRGLIRSTE
jgi:predicted small metal-binding protein